MADGSGENDGKDRTDRSPSSDRGGVGVEEAQSTADVSQSAPAGTPPAEVERVWTPGTVGSGQTLQFTGPGAELDIGNAGAFQGRIGGFASGDVIGLTGVAYDSTPAATDNAQTATVTVTDGGQTVATLGNVQAQAGPLTVTKDLHGVTSQTPYVSGIEIGYTPSPSDGLNGSDVRPDPQADIQGAISQCAPTS